ncbi:hypothetical protein ACIOJD_01050 [Streptomyces sp. NPDC088116]|uniref:hypothetical protein n=1 Tax=Streptomyces sp. NPDC088116 TaxID=3365825 RepID=UPI00382A6CDE
MNPTPKTQTTEPETTEATADTKVAETEATAPEAGSAEERDAAPAATEDVKDAGEPADQDDALEDDETHDDDTVTEHRPAGIGAAAAAVVSVCLGIVALTGTWTSRIIGERATLVGQIKTGQSATPEQQISALYGDAWHATAAVNGVVALVALLVGVIVLTLPQRAGRAAWVRPVAVAGAVLGLLGLLVSFGMYFDLLVALPSAAA